MFFSKLIIIFLNFLDYFQQKKIIKLVNGKFTKSLVVVDVGAHHGETIKLLSNNLRLKKIYSIEASPENFKILKKKFQKKKKDGIKIYNFGLGDKISQNFINQTVESSSSTINQINHNSDYLKKKLKILNIKNNKKFYQKIPIKIYTLDHFIKKNNINIIDLLKIDTEGYEYNILKGASKYFHLIHLIYFEHHYDDMIVKNYKFSDIHDLLKKKRFKMIKKSKMLFRKSFEYVYENEKFRINL